MLKNESLFIIRPVLIAAIVFVSISGGCASSHKRFWKTAEFARPLTQSAPAAEPSSNPTCDFETSYAKAVALEIQDSADCVDWYLQTAKRLWPIVAANFQRELVSQPEHVIQQEHDSRPTRESDAREVQLYNSSVGKLIETSQRYGRFDSVHGIRNAAQQLASQNQPDFEERNSTNSEPILNVRYDGFAWQPSDFENITVVGEYRTPDVIHLHRQTGIGVPLLVRHTSKRPFVYPHATFAATAIIRPSNMDTGGGQHRDDVPFVLDIVNPLTIRETEMGGKKLPVTFDLTAAIAYLSVNEDREWLKGLLRPEEVESGLTMIEPYQPGKFPVVFVHGLASDPMTWAAMANELFIYPDLLHNFQFWIFSYPTGKPFPNEAANLRRELIALRQHIDPQKRDAALDQMVLVGHSMGGLLSKLQISSSGDRLSNAIFKIPFDELELTPDMHTKFADFLFFEPSNQVRRVIFIGTPHRGSKLAETASSLTSRLIRQSGALYEQCTQFIKLNQAVLKTPTRRLPTSIDLLKPDNPILQSVFELPVDPRVNMHSIIGDGHKGRFGKEPSDGVVPVSSARHPDVDSELLVDADHGLHHHPDTINEVVRILREHAAGTTAVSDHSADNVIGSEARR